MIGYTLGAGEGPHQSLGLGGGRLAYDVGVVVERGVLDHGGKHEQEADCDKQVHGGDVGDAGERGPGHRAQRGHGQHAGDTWGTRRKSPCRTPVGPRAATPGGWSQIRRWRLALEASPGG